MALADFKSVVPRDERGRWVRLPRTPANILGTNLPHHISGGALLSQALATQLTGADNFMQVEHKTTAGWQAVADDGDWSTRVRWRTEGSTPVAQLSWDIPADTPAGDYRITHLGYDSSGERYRGESLITISP